MATEEDRSLKSGIGLPQWMKKNMDTRYDFDQSAFSPPTYDEDFFHLKYKKSIETSDNLTTNTDQTKYHNIEVNSKSVSQHIQSCKEFIPYNKNEIVNFKEKIIKPKGTDDGFYGEGAACGNSIITVAQQVLTGKYHKVRGYTTDDTDHLHPERYIRQRRNSKSLPASPLSTPMSTPDSSPKLKRKHGTTNPPLVNRFFTGPFTQMEDAIQEEEKKKSWLLTGLLTQQRETSSGEIVSARSSLEETRKTSNQSTSDESVASEKISINIKVSEMINEKLDKPIYKPKPSELREMNFWSPTSM